MLITSLLPLLSRYSLGFDLIAGAGEMVTLTIIPRKAESAKHALEPGEARPISITGTAAEIDEQLALGTDGALGQLIASRKSLADQIAEQRTAAEAAKAKAKPADKGKSAAAAESAPASPPAQPAPGEPATLW